MSWIFLYLPSGALMGMCFAWLGMARPGGARRKLLLCGLLLGCAMTLVALYKIAESTGLVQKLAGLLNGSGGLVALCVAAAVGGYVRFLFAMCARPEHKKASSSDARVFLDDELV